MNYEFILQERCEFRGTSQHEDCDGFCYLRKNIEHQHNGDSENPHSDKTVINSQFSSIYGVLESNAKLSTPISIDKPYPSLDSLSKYSIFLEVLSPPPRS